VDDAIAIPLKRGANRILFLRAEPAAAVAALRRLRRKDVALALFELLANLHDAITPPVMPA
jgi:hypothetical protein